MKFALLTVLFATSAFASVNTPKVVYGTDNRAEPSAKPLWYHPSRATVAMVSNSKLRRATAEGFPVTGNHGEEFNLCKKERFYNQPTMAGCSGFLVSEDTVITAGHCITSQSDCNNNSWVFDYEMDGASNPSHIKPENVFKCQSIISRSYGGNAPDYAVIKLATKSTREPLKLLDPSLSASVGDDLVMFGFPSGIPLKITDGGQILEAGAYDFVTNLDAFHGNSGSPVLDEKSGLVVGILVSGHADYRTPLLRRCMKVDSLRMSKGEEKITSIKVVPRNF